MQRKDRKFNIENQEKLRMNQSFVVLNASFKKFICVDFQATLDYEYIKVGEIYNEAVLDINGDFNLNPNEFILLLVHGYPFYVKKEYLCRIDEENDSFRKVISRKPIFLN